MMAKNAWFVFFTGLMGLTYGCASPTRTLTDIDPRAEDTLKKMSAAVGGAQSFTFRSDATMDEPTAMGQLAQHSRRGTYQVRRPDRIHAESQAGGDEWSIWYQDSNLTLLDKTDKAYAVVTGLPGRTDDMLDDAAEKHGLTFPLADFLFSDPYKVLTENAHTGRYVGQSDVDGATCHHLLFTQENIDWQIWIDTASPSVPRKFVVDYKSLPGRPQFTARMTDWNLSAPSNDDQFKPVLPQGATQVELNELMQTMR